MLIARFQNTCHKKSVKERDFIGFTGSTKYWWIFDNASIKVQLGWNKTNWSPEVHVCSCGYIRDLILVFFHAGTLQFSPFSTDTSSPFSFSSCFMTQTSLIQQNNVWRLQDLNDCTSIYTKKKCLKSAKVSSCCPLLDKIFYSKWISTFNILINKIFCRPGITQKDYKIKPLLYPVLQSDLL